MDYFHNVQTRNTVLIHIYLYACIFIRVMVIGCIYTYTGNVSQYWWRCTPSQSIGLFWWVHGPCVECHLLFSLVSPIVSCSMIIKLLLGYLGPLAFVLSNILTFCALQSLTFQDIPPPPPPPWTFFRNIGFNMVLSGPTMSHLDTQLRFSSGEFQAF